MLEQPLNIAPALLVEHQPDLALEVQGMVLPLLQLFH